ncbi:MAG: hypothetical protein JOS17DRAFT_254596 [Linnemannia elongata]|nr:MAG: hypothetical protein JOS17DRAFT_254596 [Linnemannia elongata]
MTRTFPLVAVFALLVTLCLSITSAIPVVKRDTDTATAAKCVHKNWESARKVLSEYKGIAEKQYPKLFEGGVPVADAPDIDELEEYLGPYQDDIRRTIFLSMIGCPT